MSQSPPSEGKPDKPGAKLPDATIVNHVRDFLKGLEASLTDAAIACDFDLLPSSSCNGLTQSNGIGVLYSDQGEFSLITPFGHIQNLGNISDDSEWQMVFDELKKFLDEFCESVQMSDDELARFADSGEMMTGFWILSIDATVISKKPRLLTPEEELSGIELEDEWERLVHE